MDSIQQSAVRHASCDKLKQKCPSQPTIRKTPVHLHKHISFFSGGALERCLQDFVNTVLFRHGPLRSLNVQRKRLLGSMKHWTHRRCQSGVLLPISYGNQCSRMQSIAKQVTLALTATHKTVKNQGALAMAWEQKE